jgi:hypothetical protein
MEITNPPGVDPKTPLRRRIAREVLAQEIHLGGLMG